MSGEGNGAVARRDREPKLSAAQRRKQAQEAGARRDRIVAIAVGTGLAIAVLIVGFGLYLTQYRPPREHALTVGEREYNASAVARRGVYFALFQGGLNRDASELVEETVERLIREQSLREHAPARVGEVTDADIDRELHERLGFGIPGEDDVPPDDAADAEADDADAADDAATDDDDAPAPVVDEAGYADALGDLLGAVELHRDEFEDLVRAEILAERLAREFEAELAESGEQLFLRRIRVPSEGLARDLRERVIAGEDVAELATQHSRDTEAGPGGEIGWRPLALLDADIAEAVGSLQAGEVTEVFERTLFYEFYVVEERDPDRALDEDVRADLAARRVDDWLAEQPPLLIDSGISEDEDEWITDRIVDRVTDALGG